MFLRQKIQDLMLRKRSRAVSSKRSLMSDTPSLPSPIAASLFTSPKGASSDPEAAVSPTSTLETKPFSAVRNPFFFDRSPTMADGSRHLPQDNGDTGAMGLGLLDALTNEDSVKSTTLRSEKRMVVFRSHFKIQRPPPSTQCSSISPVEFGIKTRESQLALHSPARSSDMLNSSPRVITGCLPPPPEMELSEDYTCVILHGPNPKTTHIFDDSIFESCGNGFVTSSMNESMSSNDRSAYAADGFLSFCHGCKKKIDPRKVIYTYRGERVFCSHECVATKGCCLMTERSADPSPPKLTLQ